MGELLVISVLTALLGLQADKCTEDDDPDATVQQALAAPRTTKGVKEEG